MNTEKRKKRMLLIFLVMLAFCMMIFVRMTLDQTSKMLFLTFVDGYTDRVIYKQKIEVGDKIATPKIPEHKGYLFAGWFDEDDNQITSFENVLTNLKLTAKYTVIESDKNNSNISYINHPNINTNINTNRPNINSNSDKKDDNINLDIIGEVTYSTTKNTNQDVIVTITTNKLIICPVGWTKIDDKHYQKVYSSNEKEIINLNDATGKKTDVIVDITWIDKEAPVLTIIGKNPAYIIVGENFIDPGVIVIDNTDENIIPIVNSNLDTSIKGKYTITYSVTDNAGNIAVIDRIIYVTADNTLKQSISSFLQSGTSYANINTITFKPNKEIPAGNIISTYDVGKYPGNVIMWIDDRKNATIGAEGIMYAPENSSNLFYNLYSLVSLNGLEYLDTSFVTNMGSMFENNNSLKALDLSSFDTSKVTNMESMFSQAYDLKILKISTLDTSKVTNMSYMFNNLHALISLDLSNFNTGNVVNMSYMLAGVDSLKILDVSSLDTSKVTNMSHMLSNNTITSIDVSNFNTSNVTDMSYMFSGLSQLQNLDVSNFDTSKVTTMRYMFFSLNMLKELDLSNFNTSNVTDMSNMFSSLKGIEELDLSNFDTSNVTNMSNMFNTTLNMKKLNLSSFNTSNVTDMSYMFYGKNSITNLDLSNFDTSKVKNMTYMFGYSGTYSTIDFRNASFKSVISSIDMFESVTPNAKIIVKDKDSALWILDKYDSADIEIISEIKKYSLIPVYEIHSEIIENEKDMIDDDTVILNSQLEIELEQECLNGIVENITETVNTIIDITYNYNEIEA